MAFLNAIKGLRDKDKAKEKAGARDCSGHLGSHRLKRFPVGFILRLGKRNGKSVVPVAVQASARSGAVAKIDLGNFR